ncbi:MAG: 50S ribosomal protein L11 methyltransferase [Hyphomicrobium sp.]|nr:50S ribosomal protein L11 methyltransferase [Hyphomicrobium sp.]
MTLQKLVADFTDRDLAHHAASTLQDFSEPAPDALTVFENGPGKWRLEAFFNDWIEGRDVVAEIAPIMGRALPPFVVEDVPDLNWVAISQAALPPVAAGRFVVHGSHDRGRVARGPTTILIDAGEAFGTAHHATTLGCLLAIDRLTRSEAFDTVLDLGCGSGVLAIAIAKALPGADIIATDMDVQSVKVAAENMRVNGVANRIATAVATGVAHPWLRQSPPFGLVVANILAGPLIRLAPALARTVARSGTLLLSGILIPQAPQVIAAYRASGFQLERHDRIVGWSTLTLRRR